MPCCLYCAEHCRCSAFCSWQRTELPIDFFHWLFCVKYMSLNHFDMIKCCVVFNCITPTRNSNCCYNCRNSQSSECLIQNVLINNTLCLWTQKMTWLSQTVRFSLFRDGWEFVAIFFPGKCQFIKMKTFHWKVAFKKIHIVKDFSSPGWNGWLKREKGDTKIVNRPILRALT